MYWNHGRRCVIKKVLFVKSPQFLSDQGDILETRATHEMIIYTKFHKDRRTFLDFLQKSKFYASELFFTYPLTETFYSNISN